MAKTFEERLIAGLSLNGWLRDKDDKSKYKAFVKWDENGYKIPYKFFIGNRGALRKGECASRSYSVGDPANQTPLYKRVLEDGDKASPVEA